MLRFFRYFTWTYCFKSFCYGFASICDSCLYSYTFTAGSSHTLYNRGICDRFGDGKMLALFLLVFAAFVGAGALVYYAWLGGI